MSVYFIARIDIHDREAYQRYEAGFMAILDAHGGRLLSVDEAPEVIEGTWECERTVLLEFPSRDAARAWYDSEAYQTLARHRHSASVADIVLVQGL